MGGISIEYSDYFDIERDVNAILQEMNRYSWECKSLDMVAKMFSGYMALLWKVHPYREGNTRTIVTFCSQFIESRGFFIDSELFKDNAQYMRTALVAASSIFTDLGDKRKPEYLEHIVLDALICGQDMKSKVSAEIHKSGCEATEDNIREIVWWNRTERREHSFDEITGYLEQLLSFFPNEEGDFPNRKIITMGYFISVL